MVSGQWHCRALCPIAGNIHATTINVCSENVMNNTQRCEERPVHHSGRIRETVATRGLAARPGCVVGCVSSQQLRSSFDGVVLRSQPKGLHGWPCQERGWEALSRAPHALQLTLLALSFMEIVLRVLGHSNLPVAQASPNLDFIISSWLARAAGRSAKGRHLLSKLM